MVRYYYIVLYSEENGNRVKVKEYNVATYTYKFSQVSQMPKTLSFEASGDFSGNLSADIYAVDVWNKRSAPICSK